MKKTLVIASLMLACPVLADAPALPKDPNRIDAIKDTILATLLYTAAGAGLGHAGPVGSSLGAKIGLGLGLLRNAENFECMVRTPNPQQQWAKRVANNDYPRALHNDFGVQMAIAEYVPPICATIATITAALGTYFSGNWILPCGISALGLLDSFRYTWRQIQFYDQIRTYIRHIEAKKKAV